MEKEYCNWEYRPGTKNSHWAYTPCKSGFNPLTRIKDCEPYIGVADYYNNKLCPICKRPIRMDYGFVKEEIVMAHGDHVKCDKKDCDRSYFGKCWITSEPRESNLNVDWEKGYEGIHANGCNYYIPTKQK